MSVAAKVAPHEDVAELMDQDRDEHEGDPHQQWQNVEPRFLGVPTEDEGGEPEVGMYAHGDIADPEAQVKSSRRGQAVFKEHGGTSAARDFVSVDGYSRLPYSST